MPRRAREVCYDGKPAAYYQVRSLRRRIGYVAQSPVLLSGTVMDNLRYGDRDASEADVRRAARVAEIHADLMRLPAGYASEIGERGANLSDGQKQRLSIARALVKDPDILAQAIESVLGQTHRDLELVVIDDGSTDGSLGIMERYARADRRVRVFTQENQGVTATANRGLEEARGDWVARLDADDLFFPEKIERQLAFVKRHPDLRIAGTRGWFINDRGRSLGLVGTEGPFTREEFLCRRQSGEPVYFIHSSTLMHREAMLAIGGYRTQFVQAEGVDLWLRAAERGYLLLKIPEPLVLYRIHCESLTMAKNAEQKLCHRWVMAGAQARRKVRPEPSFAMFRAAERHRPPGEKAGAFLLEAGERLYQKEACGYAPGK